MKRLLIYTLVAFFASCYKMPSKPKIADILDLPRFKIVSLDSSQYVNTEDLPAGNPMLFIYFGPECKVCQQETKELLEHLDQLQHTNIYMISSEATEEAEIFKKAFRLDTAKNIFIGSDYDYSFYKIYLPINVPFIAIYDGNKKLRKIYREKTPIASIIRSTRI